jgi:hypothetical protein
MAEEKKDKAPAAEKPAPKPHAVKDAHPHGKKIGKMSLAELDEAIAECQKTQGGLWSRHGQSLAGRRAALTAQAPVRLKKAA